MSVLGSKNSTTSVADLTNGFVDTAQTGVVVVTLANNDTTPTVAGSNAFLASNSSPTSITNFDSGVEGQLIRVLATNGNTTIVHDTTKIKLFGGVNIVMGTNTARTFQRDASNIWWEIGGGGGASFDDGADPSLSRPGDDADTGNDTFAARRDHVHEREEIIFYDDFMYDPQSDPAPSANGVWRTGSQGAGGSWATEAGDTDTSAFGVHRLFSNATVSDCFSIHLWERSSPTKPITLVPGLEIGMRVRRHSTDYTRARFSLSIGDGFSGDSSQTKLLAFGMYKSNEDLRGDAGLGQDLFFFEVIDTAESPNYEAVSGGVTSATFTNLKVIIGASQTVSCYVNGSLVGTLSGVNVPLVTEKLGIQIYQRTTGTNNPSVSQKAYIDRFYIDTSRVDRGSN